MIFVTRRILFLLFLFGAALTASAQSTLASLAGSVRDAQGALVRSAQVTVTRTEDQSQRTAATDSQGAFLLLNLPPGTYTVRATSPSFTPVEEQGVLLTARQNLRLDLTLTAGASAEVTVNADNAGSIDTADAQVSATLSTRAVLDLPANFRGAGSTSPLSVIQVLPGVQPDSGTFPPQPSASPNPAIKFSIQGGLPSQSETTVDGISAQNQTSNNILGDAFPSAEAISEIRVDGVNNNAQYGQPGEITTISKSGANQPHGSAYWFFQNSGFDAIPFGTDAANKPKKGRQRLRRLLQRPRPHPAPLQRPQPHLLLRRLRRPALRHLARRAVRGSHRAGAHRQTSRRRPPPSTIPSPAPHTPTSASPPTPHPPPSSSSFPCPTCTSASPSPRCSPRPPPTTISRTKRNDIDSNQYDLRVDPTFGSRLTPSPATPTSPSTRSCPTISPCPTAPPFATYRILASSLNLRPHPAPAQRVPLRLHPRAGR